MADTPTTLAVKRVVSSADLMKQGDYCFIPKREPVRTYETTVVERPRDVWSAILTVIFRRPMSKQLVKETVVPQWPEYDAIIINCPQCNQPCATSKDHRIVSVEPLTIGTPVTCPYCRTVTFNVTDGNLSTA